MSADGIHEYFGLTYANYLVLNRTLLQSMPGDWQERFVAMLQELDAAFAHVELAEAYEVVAGREREVSHLTPAEARKLGISFAGGSGEAFYREGEEIPAWSRVVVPEPDPVPHYNRGRSRVEPRLQSGTRGEPPVGG
jgi:hypothetical protein